MDLRRDLAIEKAEPSRLVAGIERSLGTTALDADAFSVLADPEFERNVDGFDLDSLFRPSLIRCTSSRCWICMPARRRTSDRQPRSGRIQHQLHQGRSRGRRTLLKPFDRLSEGSSSGLPVLSVELGLLLPSQSVLGTTSIARAASSRLRGVRSAANAASFLRPDFVPWPFI